MKIIKINHKKFAGRNIIEVIYKSCKWGSSTTKRMDIATYVPKDEIEEIIFLREKGNPITFDEQIDLNLELNKITREV